MTDDLPGNAPGPGDDEAAADLESLQAELSDVLYDFAERNELAAADLAYLLLHEAVSHRALAYVLETEKPSEGGLKLDLDRFGRDFGEILRETKKEAREMLRTLVENLASDEADEDAR